MTKLVEKECLMREISGLRDTFAAQALAALVREHGFSSAKDQVAVTCYQWADAMLRAREVTNEQ